MKKKFDVTISSGNIFEDLGFPDAQERLAKVDLAIQINNLIQQKKLTQIQAAQLLGVDQPKISELCNGKISSFSLERLFRYLTLLGQDITIAIAPKPRSKKVALVSITTTKRAKKPTVTPKTTPETTAVYAKKKNK